MSADGRRADSRGGLTLSPGARCLRHGTIAGVLAGTLLAVLFYFYDLGRAAPLQTPAFLFGALTGQAEVEPTAGVVAAYTVLHYAVWAGLGALAAALIEYAGLPRSIWVGAVFGLFACSLLFYGGLIVVGTEVLSAPSWPAVFFGNTLAGVTIFAVLIWVAPDEAELGVAEFFHAHRTLRHGIIAGLLGAAVVAVWFLILDVLVREPLYTPAALGTVLLEGGQGPADVAVSAGIVLGYSVIHVTFFLLAGLVLAGLTEQVHRFPPLIFGLIILFVVFETLFVALVAVLGAWVLRELAWWSVMVGNLLAAAAMGAYMWRVYPALQQRLRGAELWTS